MFNSDGQFVKFWQRHLNQWRIISGAHEREGKDDRIKNSKENENGERKNPTIPTEKKKITKRLKCKNLLLIIKKKPNKTKLIRSTENLYR